MDEKNNEKFKSLTASVSCILILTELSNELEVSKLISFVEELKVAQKYLIIFLNTLNTIFLGDITINFDVIINHRGRGKTKNNHLPLITLTNIRFLDRWKLDDYIIMSNFGKDVF